MARNADCDAKCGIARVRVRAPRGRSLRPWSRNVRHLDRVAEIGRLHGERIAEPGLDVDLAADAPWVTERERMRGLVRIPVEHVRAVARAERAARELNGRALRRMLHAQIARTACR